MIIADVKIRVSGTCFVDCPQSEFFGVGGDALLGVGFLVAYLLQAEPNTIEMDVFTGSSDHPMNTP
jgi:hypothetical protein